jgi:hypothetical protein
MKTRRRVLARYEPRARRFSAMESLPEKIVYDLCSSSRMPRVRQRPARERVDGRVWHEGYHHGQMKLALKVAGRPMTDKDAGPLTWGVWMRKK